MSRLDDSDVLDIDLDVSFHRWNRNLACGFKFDEVSLRRPGVPRNVSGDRYYNNPENQLYENTRVLKLHGSIDWLRYTPMRIFPTEYQPEAAGSTPTGIFLDSSPNHWNPELLLSFTKGSGKLLFLKSGMRRSVLYRGATC